MSNAPLIIRSNDELFSSYQKLQAGDIIACRLRLKYGEEHLLLDLIERGVKLIPSATCQLSARSKTFQARLLGALMIPLTVVIYDIHGLLNSISLYGEHDIEKVVLKHDRKNAGLGIHLFRSIEDVYTQAANDVLPYPFVLQPFVPNSRDIRVIVIDDFIEAYERNNPHNFRNNLHCGGKSSPVQLSDSQVQLCATAMQRGNYPYAHLDLMVTATNQTYLTEINLRGGMRGATVSPSLYKTMIKKCEETLLSAILN